MKRVHVESKVLSAQSWGTSNIPPCVLKLCMSSPGEQETALAVVPQVSARLLSLRPHPSFCLSCLNSRPGQSGSSAFPAKNKPFLTPDDQACSRLVWCVAAPGFGGGEMHASNLYSVCQLPGEQGLGEKSLQGAGERAPQTIRLPERRERRTIGSV